MLIRLSDCPEQPSRHGNPKQVLLREGILPDVTQVAVASFPEPVETEVHTHPTMYEVYFCLEGEAIYRLGDDDYHVTPGDFLIVPPGTPHHQKVTKAPHRIFYWGIATSEPNS